MLIWCLIIIGSILLDQLSKILVVEFLSRETPLVVIEGVFRFTYVENDGAAFGMLDDHRWIFMVLSVIGISAVFIYLLKFRPSSRLACTALAFIIGGGIGNMIDRVRLGYVIDFIDFYAFPNVWMWVFNVADSFVCVGAGMLILYLILDIVKDSKKQKEALNGEAITDSSEGDSSDE